MMGNMMNSQLLIQGIFESAVTRYPEQEIVSRLNQQESQSPAIHRYTYKDAYRRTCQLANSLIDLGVSPGDRIATLASNHYRHLETYYAVSGIGSVIHTVNVRLFPEQIAWIINHAQDTVLFLDPEFVPLIQPIHHLLTSVKRYVIYGPRPTGADAGHSNSCSVNNTCSLPNMSYYEELIQAQAPDFQWPVFKEQRAAGLCYTSGTTGNPKGVLYTHRSTVLHAIMSGGSQFLNFDETAVVMPVVPMYHVSAWGIPYSALLYGSKLVLPGNQLDGWSLHELIETEQVTQAYGVPTVWLNLHEYLQTSGQSLTSLKVLGVGGAASPTALVKTYAESYGVYWMGIWGMTETSPLVTAAIPTPEMKTLPPEIRYQRQASAGRPIFGTQIGIFDEQNHRLPQDGKTRGELRVKGPWVLSEYYNHQTPDVFTQGWFSTGDIAVIDEKGYLNIVDRVKDVIKSGGEWISSVELEAAALHHPQVKEACVIGVPHPKWDERPIMLVTLHAGYEMDETALRATLADHVAKWWLPDQIHVVDSLPHTGTGKLTKVALRQQYKNTLRETST